MKKALALTLSGFMLAANSTSAEPTQADSTILAMGVYVPTDDMAKSEAFYRTLFNRPPVIELDNFVAFDIAGGWFALVSRARYAPDAVPGSGSVPYLQSSGLEDLQTRVARTGHDVPEIIEEPGIHLLKIVDPNGQLIEFFRFTDQ